VSRGGIEIRSAEALSVPAFLASISSTASLVSALLGENTATFDPILPEARNLWWLQSGGMDVDEPSTNLQRDWELPVLEAASAALLESASSAILKARILSVTNRESGSWLNALPCPALGTFLNNEELRVAVGLRLGTPICHPHTCRCGSEVDQFGVHGLSCQKSAGRIPRHAEVYDILKRAFVSAGVPARKEPSGLFRLDNKRPDGLTLIPWADGRCLLWDATCVDTLARTHLSRTSRNAGGAAATAEVKKIAKYMPDIQFQYIFCPFAVETMGAFGEEALKLVKA